METVVSSGLVGEFGFENPEAMGEPETVMVSDVLITVPELIVRTWNASA